MDLDVFNYLNNRFIIVLLLQLIKLFTVKLFVEFRCFQILYFPYDDLPYSIIEHD
jgi:hypothetical protein